MNPSDLGKAIPNAFAMGLDKAAAWDKARQLAEFWERMLHASFLYRGPLVVAGGFVRDLALKRPVKDLDLWLDSGLVDDKFAAMGVADRIAGVIGHGAHVHSVIPCYGTWAEDIQYVCKISLDPAVEVPMCGAHVLPHELDVIFLRRKALQDAGYKPEAVPTAWGRLHFLHAVLRRVDLRVNAIGANRDLGDSHEKWDLDALAQRLVVQNARASEDTARIIRRLDRLAGPDGKYTGWDRFMEGAQGELTPC